jgi:hypothetical protein
MALRIIDYIGNTINNENKFFASYKTNGVQLPSGEVIGFSDKGDKEFIGAGDNLGTAFYIRFNPQISFSAERRISSIRAQNSAVKQCRLVAFTWDKMSSEWLMAKLISDLKKVNFSNYAYSRRPSIVVKKSNHNYTDNIQEEYKKELKEISQEFICISIDFELKYYQEECDCEEEPLTCNYDSQ